MNYFISIGNNDLQLFYYLYKKVFAFYIKMWYIYTVGGIAGGKEKP